MEYAILLVDEHTGRPSWFMNGYKICEYYGISQIEHAANIEFVTNGSDGNGKDRALGTNVDSNRLTV